MAQLYASVAIGTAATLLATLLLLLRTEIHGRRPVVALTRRWVAASTRTSCLIVVLLSAIAVSCFAAILVNEEGQSVSASALSAFADAPSVQGVTSDPDESSRAAQELAALRAYVDKTDAKPQPAAAASSAADTIALPDVETMIAQLVARLEEQPDDVKGWKMLGWSYLNTDRPEDAARAYETALKLAPGDVEIKKGLETAQSAQTAATGPPPPGPAP